MLATSQASPAAPWQRGGLSRDARAGAHVSAAHHEPDHREQARHGREYKQRAAPTKRRVSDRDSGGGGGARADVDAKRIHAGRKSGSNRESLLDGDRQHRTEQSHAYSNAERQQDHKGPRAGQSIWRYRTPRSAQDRRLSPSVIQTEREPERPVERTTPCTARESSRTDRPPRARCSGRLGSRATAARHR